MWMEEPEKNIWNADNDVEVNVYAGVFEFHAQFPVYKIHGSKLTIPNEEGVSSIIGLTSKTPNILILQSSGIFCHAVFK